MGRLNHGKRDIRGRHQQMTERRKQAIKEPKPKETSLITLYKTKRSSKKGRREDALALRAEERRDKLRKAAGRSKYPGIRRYLNGETHAGKPCVSMPESIGYGGEPGELKHLSSRRKRKQKFVFFGKQKVIPRVAASEMGRAQTGMRASRGLDCIRHRPAQRNGTGKTGRRG